MTTKSEEKVPIPKKLEQTEEFMKERVGLGVSFDLGVRKFQVLKKGLNLYYINGLCDTEFVIELLKELVDLNEHQKLNTHIFTLIENRLVNQSVTVIKTLDELVDQVLTGLVVFVLEGEDHALVVDVRSYPGRTPSEPDTEKVVRGSRDGYVENIIINTALTRRRIHDERLRFEIIKVGERSKTDVAIGYIKDVANPNLIESVRKKIQDIKIDGLTMADKTVEEFMVRQGYNPYPLVRYTERADVGAAHLLEGHVLVYVDTSPSVIITPTTYFHHVQHAEEFRQSPAVGTFVRWIRFIGIFTSIFLLPLWYLFILEPSMLPEGLAFIGPNEQTNMPVLVQILIADIGVEILRMAAIHTPTPLATAMSLVAAVILGQIAIDVGMFVGEVILYVAAATLGTFATPSLELSVANKFARLFLLICIAIFKAPGFVVGTTIYLLFLVGIKAFKTPYLWPLIPFNIIAFIQILVRKSIPGSKIRPSIVHPRNRYKQPGKS
ncbi:spore germination protein [Bacillus testis]|uniref:spore germination protein n=1 Tax=Bacillus testis TaxID=1622072 RepID=UPI00067EE4E7|nr:spore germination protein [Bacillus testis]